MRLRTSRGSGLLGDRLRNHLDLLSAIPDGPIASGTSNDIELLQEVRLIPVDADFLDASLLEVDNVDLQKT